MPHTRSNTRSAHRAASSTRAAASATLKAGHERMQTARRDFHRLPVVADLERRQVLVIEVPDERPLHAALDDALLFPVGAGAAAGRTLVDETEVEHEPVRTLIDRLRGMRPVEPKPAPGFTILCESVMHQVKADAGEPRPGPDGARLDWRTLAAEWGQFRPQEAPADAEAAGRSGVDTANAVAPKKVVPRVRRSGAPWRRSHGPLIDMLR